VREMLPRQGHKAGITRRCHAHSLRHTSAVALMHAGIPLVTISKQLRHSSISVTHTYLDHISPEEVISAVRDVCF
jgi:site-specific recombinase XerD